MNKKQAELLVNLCVAVLLLQGCGFHLRGSVDLPDSMSAMYIHNEGAGEITKVLRRILNEQDMPPVENRQEAGVIINVRNEIFDKRVSAVDSRGKVEEFELTYAVNLSLFDNNDVRLGNDQRLALKRELRFNQDQVQGKSLEEQLLKQEMINDAARQVLRRIQFLNR